MSDTSDGNPLGFEGGADDFVQIHQMIAIAAYYRAEKRNFSSGNVLADWLESEYEIKKRLPPNQFIL
jgi:hypothetical protein